MSLLDDARRVAETDPLETDRGGRGECRYCSGGNYEGEYLSGSPTLLDALHKPDCPWPSMSKIVAALEAAEQVMVDSECDPHQRVDGWRLSISLPLLRAALRGES